MFEFINYIGSVLTFVFFLTALYLNKSSKEKSYFLVIVTGVMFAYTLFGMPFVQKAKAEKNIAIFEKGLTLSCTSGFLMFGNSYTLDRREWILEKNYFINIRNKEQIRADKCEEN